MRSTRPVRRTSRFSPWRSLIIALVLCLHGGLWIALRWAAAPWVPPTLDEPSQAGLALSVRLLDAVTLRHELVNAPPVEHKVLAHPVRERSRSHASATATSPAAAAVPLPPPAPLHDLPPASPPIVSGVAAQPGRFIPGGVGFQQQLRVANESSHAPLPDNTLAHAPHFAMADPRTHGLAGLARALQHITGAVDKVCLNADVDSHMSDQELLDHQLSRADLRQMILAHNCDVKGGLP